MATILFANNAKTNLAAALTSSATTATLTPGAGSKFPSPGAGQYFVLTLTDAATGLINEIVWVTARSGDTLTIVRGQEGTTAAAWLIGDYASCFPTAGTLASLIQPDQAQIGTYEYAVAAGTANALTGTVGSNLTALPDGMPVTIKASAANTSTVTLQLTLGSTVLSAHPVVKGNNSPLVASDIPAAGYLLQLNWSATFNAFLMQNPANGISSIPPGAVFMFPCTAANAPSGFLVAEGQLVSRTTYAALYAFAVASGNIVSDTAWTGGAYGAFSTGDGSTTFRLPQYGGYFLRPLDNGNGIDPSRTIGTVQANALQSHNHTASSSSSTPSASTTITDLGHYHSESATLGVIGKSYLGNGTTEFSGSGSTAFGTGGSPFATNGATTGITASTTVGGITTTTTVNNTGGTETRPINISVLTCIKY